MKVQLSLRYRLLLMVGLLALATLLAIVMALYRQPVQTPNGTATETGPATQEWARQQIVEHLPDLALPDLEGNLRSLDDWSGRPMVINVWATWCAPCREEIPLLIELQARFDPEELTVIGLGLDDPEAMREFATTFGINYPLLGGEPEVRAATRQFGSDQLGLPHTFFVDGNGTIRDFHLGLISSEQLMELVDTLHQPEN